jgi:hypothetical protein
MLKAILESVFGGESPARICHHESRMMKTKRISVWGWVGLLGVFGSTIAHAAITLQITNRQYLNGGLAGTLDPIADSLETSFNSSLSATSATQFLTEMGNANAGATRSILASGTNENSTYIGSFGVNGALSGGASVRSTSNSLPSVGLATQAGITLGANGEKIKLFRGLDAKRVLYHLSFYSADLSSYFSASGITMDSMQASAGLSYQIYHTESWIPGLVRFNGIRVASGLSYGNFTASYTTPFRSASGGINMQSDVTFTVDSKIYTWSSEAVTGLRLANVLDLYTGFGVDFNLGSTSLSASSENGAVSASNGGTTVFAGDATIDGTADVASPTIVQMRFLLGTQANLGPLGIYLAGQISTPTVLCLNFGAKLAF